jgi:hypothetical protein
MVGAPHFSAAKVIGSHTNALQDTKFNAGQTTNQY